MQTQVQQSLPMFYESRMIRRYSLLLILFALSHHCSFSQSRDLNFYLEQGIQNSPLLKDYSNQLQQKKFDSLLIRAQKKISVSANGSVMIAPIINGVGYDEAITNQGQYSAVVGANYSPFQKNMVGAQLKSVGLQSQMITVNKKLSERELEKAITDQYLTGYSGLSQIKFEEQTIASLENQLNLLEPLVQHGIYLQTDYLTLQLQIQTEKINLQQLKDDYRSNLYALNVLCGIADTTTLDLEKPDLIWRVPTAYSNPKLLMYSLDSSSIAASRDSLRYNYVPKVNLFGDAGYQAVPTNFSVNKFGFSAGVSVAWNIYDGGKKNLKMQQLSIQQETANYYKSNYSTQLSLQLADLNKKLENSNSIVSQLQDQLNNMKKLISLRRDQLEAGQLSVIDYLSTIRDYRELNKNLNDALIKQQQIINEHNYLVW